MNPVVFLPQAEQEMLEAARYYESQAVGLGADYLLEVELCNSSYCRVTKDMANN